MIEDYRYNIIKSLFELKSFYTPWPTWKKQIKKKIKELNSNNIINLGDDLREIMFSTNKGRNQSTQSAGGKAWECLICWYLNLCLVGSKTIIIRPIKAFNPKVIKDAISVNYSTFSSNTESDLMAIKFSEEINSLEGSFNIDDIDKHISENIDKISIYNIQCKTNWNDNAQIPMLWDIVYQAEGFKTNYISVGSNNRKLSHFNEFKYCFVTAPTQKNTNKLFKQSSTCVKRVHNISGGNYWGMKTKQGVAFSIKEIITKHFDDGNNLGSIRADLNNSIKNINNYQYFDFAD